MVRLWGFGTVAQAFASVNLSGKARTAALLQPERCITQPMCAAQLRQDGACPTTTAKGAVADPTL